VFDIFIEKAITYLNMLLLSISTYVVLFVKLKIHVLFKKLILSFRNGQITYNAAFTIGYNTGSAGIVCTIRNRFYTGSYRTGNVWIKCSFSRNGIAKIRDGIFAKR